MEIYIAEVSRFGTPSIIRVVVRETAKLYIVEQVEAVLERNWAIRQGSHLRKDTTATFDTELDAYDYLVDKLADMITRAEERADRLRQTKESLRIVAVHKRKDQEGG